MKSADSDGDGKFVVYDSNNFGLRAFGSRRRLPKVGLQGAPIGLV